MTEEKLSPRALIQTGPGLGAMRTMMAADRTLMAWIRTSLSMYSFGYTIYKVLQEVNEVGDVVLQDTAPRRAGMLLSVAGTAALIMGIIEYSATLRLLRRSYSFPLSRPSLIMALIMAAAGMFLCFGIGTRVV
jgi:putative membrane protein